MVQSTVNSIASACSSCLKLVRESDSENGDGEAGEIVVTVSKGGDTIWVVDADGGVGAGEENGAVPPTSPSSRIQRTPPNTDSFNRGIVSGIIRIHGITNMCYYYDIHAHDTDTSIHNDQQDSETTTQTRRFYDARNAAIAYTRLARAVSTTQLHHASSAPDPDDPSDNRNTIANTSIASSVQSPLSPPSTTSPCNRVIPGTSKFSLLTGTSRGAKHKDKTKRTLLDALALAHVRARPRGGLVGLLSDVTNELRPQVKEKQPAILRLRSRIRRSGGVGRRWKESKENGKEKNLLKAPEPQPNSQTDSRQRAHSFDSGILLSNSPFTKEPEPDAKPTSRPLTPRSNSIPLGFAVCNNNAPESVYPGASEHDAGDTPASPPKESQVRPAFLTVKYGSERLMTGSIAIRAMCFGPSQSWAAGQHNSVWLQQTQASTNEQTQQQQSSSPTAATSSPTLQSPPNSASSSAHLAILLTNASAKLGVCTMSPPQPQFCTFRSASGQTGSPNGTANAQPQTNGTPQMPESAVNAMLESNDRAERAEKAREDAELHIVSQWTELERYLGAIKLRAPDAHAGFTRMAGSLASSPESSAYAYPSSNPPIANSTSHPIPFHPFTSNHQRHPATLILTNPTATAAPPITLFFFVPASAGLVHHSGPNEGPKSAFCPPIGGGGHSSASPLPPPPSATSSLSTAQHAAAAAALGKRSTCQLASPVAHELADLAVRLSWTGFDARSSCAICQVATGFDRPRADERTTEIREDTRGESVWVPTPPRRSWYLTSSVFTFSPRCTATIGAGQTGETSSPPPAPRRSRERDCIEVEDDIGTFSGLLAEHRHDRATRFRWIVHLGVRIELRAASSAESIIMHGVGVEAVRERWAKDGRERVGVLGGLLKTAKEGAKDKDKEGAKGRKESKDAEKNRNKEKGRVKKEMRETETKSRRGAAASPLRKEQHENGGESIMTILDAATANPAFLINQLHLEATPDASPRSYHAGSVPRQSQGDEEDTQHIFPHRLDTSLKKIETVGGG
ncbi:hypothetical protein BD410DRAFT_801406 [Rickenella mellea]|uniref:Uncharacterized protein n=1 Tax=Rickenella mellea TaxID=50990 RepID=A0A4Y7QCG7_9AGAM|nr:hypothetical protein BD410DRAFT_801406 [Rickenella mellea]